MKDPNTKDKHVWQLIKYISILYESDIYSRVAHSLVHASFVDVTSPVGQMLVYVGATVRDDVYGHHVIDTEANSELVDKCIIYFKGGGYAGLSLREFLAGLDGKDS